MPQHYVMGNWKMNGTKQQVLLLLQELLTLFPQQTNTHCVVFPPALYLPLVGDLLINTPIQWGAQNCYPKEQGAYTGELSTAMLSDYHCSHILVGHSERRQIFKEDEKIIAEKFHHVKLHDMIPVLCIGETLEQREEGLTEQVLQRQLLTILENGENFNNSIIAYEPVWAIGTGKTALPEQVQEVHSFIRKIVGEFDHIAAKQLPILYGGSVNEKNARSLFAMPDVNGGLIGGASLNAQQFVEIIKCIN